MVDANMLFNEDQNLVILINVVTTEGAFISDPYSIFIRHGMINMKLWANLSRNNLLHIHQFLEKTQVNFHSSHPSS